MPARLRVRRSRLNARAPLPARLPWAPSASACRPPGFVWGVQRRPSDALSGSAERGRDLCSTPSSRSTQSSRDGVECVLCVPRERALAPVGPVSIWLANGAKVGTLVEVTIVETFLVWFELGSATTFQNLVNSRPLTVWGQAAIIMKCVLHTSPSCLTVLVVSQS